MSNFNTYSILSGPMVAGVIAVNLPAGSFNFNSKILSINRVTTGGAVGNPYSRGVAISENSNIATITLNSMSATDTSTYRITYRTPAN